MIKLLLKKDFLFRFNLRVVVDIVIMVILFLKWIDICEECLLVEMIRKSIVLLVVFNLFRLNVKKDNFLVSFF